MKTITFQGRQLWPRPPRARHAAPPDPRSLERRWEDGPGHPPAPLGGSMLRDYEQAGRQAYTGAHWAYQARCDDTGEHYGTALMPRLAPFRPAYGIVPHCCPRCEAPDDGPHYPGCPFYDPDEASLFAVQFDGLPEPVTLRARQLDPDAWRPYLTAEEFAESFPGVPYDLGDQDQGPHTGDLMFPLSPGLADQLDQLDRETDDYLAERAAAHADTRARMILAWQAIWQQNA